jgi:deoxyribonuclease V
VAKSRLYGRYDPAQMIGAVLRTREGANPPFISPGHLIDVPHAVEWALRCVTHFRLPEPTRWAHKFAAGERLPLDDGLQPRPL